jgi:hypothetical protein
MAPSLVERRWFPKSQPPTLQIAVALLYWNAVLLLLSGIIGLHFGPVALLALVADVAGGFGVANERRWGYVVALLAALLPFVGFFILSAHTYFGGGFLTLIFDVALVALLLHPMSRGYFKTWFR